MFFQWIWHGFQDCSLDFARISLVLLLFRCGFQICSLDLAWISRFFMNLAWISVFCGVLGVDFNIVR